MKEISVIIASQDAKATIAKCLSSLEKQNRGGRAEIIVVDNSKDGTAKMVEEAFPTVRLIRIAEPRLLPELWAIGAKEALGKIIAFTIAHCVPDEDWLAATLRHHQSGTYAAIGGAIENAQPSPLSQWATYFCRYVTYMLPFSTHPVDQIPGDNASYKRWVLEEYAHWIESCFWETVINQRLRRAGHSLLLTPEICVFHEASSGVGAFCRQRFTHGRIFGAGRVVSVTGGRRLLYIFASPLVPFIFLAKIVRQVLQKKRHVLQFLLSLPILVLFVLCWSFGEFLGYLTGKGAKP